MIDKWVVFSGWSVDPNLLQPLFNDRITILDSTHIAGSLLRNGNLTSNWRQDLTDLIRPSLPAKPFGIAGWSTGAIMAWASAENLAPDCIVCLSATPAFCIRPGFAHGQHPSMLRAMRKKLALQPGAVLKSFYEECGVPEEHLSTFRISVPSLVAGLRFLEQASLFPLEQSGIPALFLHGDSDTIVPASAGRYFSQQAGGIFEAYDGPHAFFISHYAAVRERIARFAGDGI